ncbi:MAG: glycoside hydrolase family 127 protein [Eubacteriales bacterium]
MKYIPFENTCIKAGFWAEKQDLVRNVSIKSVYERFADTGRFAALDFNWKEGMPNRPHIFWDSDVAKWLESVAFLLAKAPEPELEKLADEVIGKIIAHQDECGYFNSYFDVVEPAERFKRRGDHELYCAGHLMEAAVAYFKATGKREFLDAMCRYADYIEKVFVIEKSAAFDTPGHVEIELALVKLADITGEQRYLELSKHFIDTRGLKQERGYDWASASYFQSHLPCREQTTAEGHSVRAVYLYSGMADIAYKYGDKSLADACKALFDNITERRMYVTGGIGSTRVGEAFTVDYDLPSVTAYTESCASLGLALFARRMQMLETDSKYADIVERIIYNGFMSSLSLDGKSFFYENPLEIIPSLLAVHGEIHYPSTRRQEVFGCSCCPPNITRFIASVADFLYTADDDDRIIYCHQFMESETAIELGGSPVALKQETVYPSDGKVKITYTGEPCTIAVRIPAWCDAYDGVKDDDGYTYFSVEDGTVIELDFAPAVKFISADPRVTGNEGRVAVSYGPVIYCVEAHDNPAPLRDIRIDTEAEFKQGFNDELNIPTLTVRAYRRHLCDSLYSYGKTYLEEFNAVLIPYYAFANRGESEMVVWLLTR